MPSWWPKAGFMRASPLCSSTRQGRAGRRGVLLKPAAREWKSSAFMGCCSSPRRAVVNPAGAGLQRGRRQHAPRYRRGRRPFVTQRSCRRALSRRPGRGWGKTLGVGTRRRGEGPGNSLHALDACRSLPGLPPYSGRKRAGDRAGPALRWKGLVFETFRLIAARPPRRSVPLPTFCPPASGRGSVMNDTLLAGQKCMPRGLNVGGA